MKLDKQMQKDLEAYLRVKRIVLDPERHAKMQKYIQDNCTGVNIFIEHVNINIGGKK